MKFGMYDYYTEDQLEEGSSYEDYEFSPTGEFEATLPENVSLSLNNIILMCGLPIAGQFFTMMLPAMGFCFLYRLLMRHDCMCSIIFLVYWCSFTFLSIYWMSLLMFYCIYSAQAITDLWSTVTGVGLMCCVLGGSTVLLTMLFAPVSYWFVLLAHRKRNPMIFVYASMAMLNYMILR